MGGTIIDKIIVSAIALLVAFLVALGLIAFLGRQGRRPPGGY
jgi:hypothetical protein